MKEQNYTYDPFQLQNAPTKQRFSLQEKVIAIILVVIFMMIPLYEISSDAFKANYVYKPEIGTRCGLYYLEMYPEMNYRMEYRQGKTKIEN